MSIDRTSLVRHQGTSGSGSFFANAAVARRWAAAPAPRRPSDRRARLGTAHATGRRYIDELEARLSAAINAAAASAGAGEAAYVGRLERLLDNAVKDAFESDAADPALFCVLNGGDPVRVRRQRRR